MPINTPSIKEEVEPMYAVSMCSGLHLEMKAAATEFQCLIYWCTQQSSQQDATFTWYIIELGETRLTVTLLSMVKLP